MVSFENVNKEYQDFRKYVNNLVEEIHEATGDGKDYTFSALLLFQSRLREFNTNLDSQSDKARRVRVSGGSASEYLSHVDKVKENRLLIAKSINEIATFIELVLKKQENICQPREERQYDRPLLNFPEFKGDFLTYLEFKNEFLCVMKFTHMREEMKASCLRQSLKEKDLSYVYTEKNYTEIWKALDRRYDDKWFLLTYKLKDFLSIQKPTDDPNIIEYYWDTAINKLRNVLVLELTMENILIYYLIDSLPTPFREDIIKRLPFDNTKTKLFSIDEATDAFCKIIQMVPCEDTEINNSKSCKQHTDDQTQSDEDKGEFPFPEFHGELSKYKYFKIMFNNTGDVYHMSNELKLHHLKLSLKHEALRYIGSWGTHHESYENMWRYLDKRYNNTWIASNKMVKEFFNMQQPIYEQRQLDHYWFTATNEIRRMLFLELNLENVFMIYIIQSLPRELQMDLVKKLQCKQQGKKVYGIDVAAESFQEVMGVWKIGYNTEELSTSNAYRKPRGYKGNRKFHGNYRSRGRGRACTRFD